MYKLSKQFLEKVLEDFPEIRLEMIKQAREKQIDLIKRRLRVALRNSELCGPLIDCQKNKIKARMKELLGNTKNFNVFDDSKIRQCLALHRNEN